MNLSGVLPPILENTLLFELTRLLRLPISNETVPFEEPEAPALVALRVTVDDGQNQLWLGEPQFGIGFDKGGVKNKPFEPLSIIALYMEPLMVVTISPIPSVAYVVIPEGTTLLA
jgi:hypothetical protein